MERLLADAEKLTGVHYDISNLSDVYTAIHEIQHEMGILGTTEEEASGTISGSIGQLGGAWKNLVAGFADAQADLPALINDVVESAETSFTNLLPTVEQAIMGVATFVDDLAPIIAEKLPVVANEIIPPILSTANDVVNTLVGALPSLLDAVDDVIPTVINDVSQTVINLLPEVSKVGLQLVLSLADSVKTNAPTLINQFTAAVNEFVDILSSPDTLDEIFDTGFGLLEALADGIDESLPRLVETATNLVVRLVEYLTNPDNIKEIYETSYKIVGSLASGLVKSASVILEAAIGLTGELTKGLLSTDWLEFGLDLVGSIVEGFADGFSDADEAFENGLNKIDQMFGTSFAKWRSEWNDFFGDVGAGLYNILHADELDALDRSTKASTLRATIVQASNEYMREGMKAADALRQAKAEALITPEDFSIFDEYLKNDLTVEEAEQRYKILGDTARQATLELNLPTEALRQMRGEEAAVLKELPKLVEETTNETSNAAQKGVKAAEEAAKIVYEGFAVQEIGTYRNLGVEQVLGHVLTDAEEVADRIASEVYSASNEFITRLTAQQDLSVEDQIDWWGKIQAQFVAGSEQYLSAGDKILDLQKKQAADLEKTEKEKTDTAKKQANERKAAAEKEYNARKKAFEDYQKSVQSISDKIKDIENSYADTLKSRSEEIYNSFSLFEKVPERILYSGVDLTNNLQEQIDTLEKFYGDISTLSERGVSTALVEAIQSMGVDAIDQLDALLDLSDEELIKYDKLFSRKNELADTVAEEQLVGLKEETNRAIMEQMEDLDALSAEAGKEVGIDFATGIAAGIKAGAMNIQQGIWVALQNAQNAFLSTSTGGSTSAASYTGTVAETTQTSTQIASNTAVTGAAGGITVNVYGMQYQNLSELTQAIGEELQFQIGRAAIANA